MIQVNRLILCLVAAPLLVACASVGRRFEFQNRDQVVLGESTPQGVTELLGRPHRRSTATDGSISFETLEYLYAHATLAGGAARVMFLEFREGRLNAFIYSSGFEEDKTDFDHLAAARIEKGVSRQADVLTILGKPTGRARCPTSLADFANRCGDCVEVWKWTYTSKGRDASSMKSKSVTIGFDGQGTAVTVHTAVDQ